MLSETVLQQAESHCGWTLTQCSLISLIFSLISGINFECKLKSSFNPIDVVCINWYWYWVGTAIHHFDMEWQLNCYWSRQTQPFSVYIENFSQLNSFRRIYDYLLITYSTYKLEFWSIICLMNSVTLNYFALLYETGYIPMFWWASSL